LTPRTLVIATFNAKKAGEMITILQERLPGIKIKTLAEYPGCPEPEETGTTYAENATIKAEGARDFTGEICIGDDSGLEIDAFDGAPGLHSKRFAGEETPFTEKMRIVLERMQGVEARGARFRCCVAISAPGKPTQICESTCEGRIADAPSGGGGFGYDPIFWLEEKGCTMADLPTAEKHKISHRGKVLGPASEIIRKLMDPD